MKLISILSAILLSTITSNAAFMVTLTGNRGSVLSIEDNSIYDNDPSIGVLSIGGPKNRFTLDNFSFETYIEYGFLDSTYFLNVNSQNTGVGGGKFSIYTSFSELDNFNYNPATLEHSGTALFFSGTPKGNTANVSFGSFIDNDNLSTSESSYIDLNDSFELKKSYAISNIKEDNFKSRYFSLNNSIEVDLSKSSHYNIGVGLTTTVFCEPQVVPEPQNILIPLVIMGVMIISKRKR
jgi:hypothetical protein